MNTESRKWFDRAYEFTRGVFPFGIVTGEFEEECIKRITRNSLSDEELSLVKTAAHTLYEILPTEEDFQEEKESILNRLVPELKKKFYFVDTAVMFGRVRGDIDIGLISRCREFDKKLLVAIYPNCDIIKKYPIVDWDALYWFKSRNGKELTSKIIKSRLMSNNTNELSIGEMQYVRDTVYNARLLWGNKGELSSMKSYIQQMNNMDEI
jgi:hypothetical protein